MAKAPAASDSTSGSSTTGPSAPDSRTPDEPGTPPTPTEPEQDVLTVAQVNRMVRRTLEGEFGRICVGGEVSNWKRSGAGHCYFTLKDADAELRCVMFRRDADALPIDPDNGMEVRAFGGLSLYEARGDYQLIVRKVEALGDEGLFRMKFEQLRRRLTDEGLIDVVRRRPLPRFPSRVGVVTSTTGAALRDILTVIRRRAPWTEVVVRGSRVQGEGASGEIAAAIELLGGSGLVDVMIVGRGGGSIEDLWAFNEEPVARAIAACPVPVVSAVGHETDTTIADLVADARAPTPSAAAEAVVPDGDALREGVRTLRPRLRRLLRAAVERREGFLSASPPRLARALERRLDPVRRRLDRTEIGMAQALRNAVDRRRLSLAQGDRLAPLLDRRLTSSRNRLDRSRARLDALSPLATLERGYAVATDGEGQVVRRVDDLPEGATFVLRVNDGHIRARSEGPADENRKE